MNKPLFLLILFLAGFTTAYSQTWEKDYAKIYPNSSVVNVRSYDFTEAMGGLLCLSINGIECFSRINNLGDTLWTKSNYLDAYGRHAVVNAVVQLPNGDYIIGTTLAYDAYDHDGGSLFYRIDSNGNILFTINRGGNYLGYEGVIFQNVMKADKNGYYISYSYDSFYDSWLGYNGTICGQSIIEKYDSSNNLIWIKKFSDIYSNAVNISAYHQITTARSNYDDIVFIAKDILSKIDKNGNLIFQMPLRPIFPLFDEGYGMFCTSDSGVVIFVDDTGHCICKFDSHGTLVNKIYVNNTNCDFGFGAEISKNRYLIQSLFNGGFCLFDENLTFLDSIPHPFKVNTDRYLSIVPNSSGGAFLVSGVSDHYDTGHIFAVNFDSLYNIHHHLQLSMYSNCLVPGDTSHLHVAFANVGTRNIDSTTATIILDSNTRFISSIPAPVSISGDTLLYAIDSLHDGVTDSVLINLYIDTTIGLGALLTFSGTSPYVNNVDRSDDTVVYCGTTISSLDPNFKSVNRQYNFTADKPLVYTVGFENTGNYFARKVVILDTLDSHLDVATLKILGASPKVPEITWNGDHVAKFNFNDIHLPDSLSDPEASHGQVVYSINTKTGTPLATPINNTAYVFFDYNDPVVTNTTTNIISTVNTPKADSINRVQAGITIYPNPSTGEITIALPSTANGWQIMLSDVFGKVVMKNSYTSNTIRMNPKIPQGLYFLKVISMDHKQTFITKVIRE